MSPNSAASPHRSPVPVAPSLQGRMARYRRYLRPNWLKRGRFEPPLSLNLHASKREQIATEHSPSQRKHTGQARWVMDECKTIRALETPASFCDPGGKPGVDE